MKIDVDKIISALEAIDAMSPGMTVAQLIEVVKSKKTEIGRMLTML